ncbi:MAG: sugar ABC transporter ATP-binding protein, partial [Lachnospiraceae bacterium]
QLSLGQRMRAYIGAALLHSPQIVFFDEPTIGVDVVGKETIRNFICELNARDRVTMIFTTNDMQDIEKTCKRLLIIDQGTKVYDGSLLGIRETYGTTRQLDVEFAADCTVAPIEHVEIRELDAPGGRKKRFLFENRKVQIDALMSSLLTNYAIRDLTVSEPEIEGLIRKIYQGEVS